MSVLRPRGMRRSLHRTALPAALLAALVACHTTPPRVTAPDRGLPPPNPNETEDSSYDWHGLLIAPFGSALKGIPRALHEVLLFRDEARTAADEPDAADAECYGTDAPAPRFVGREPDEYLLCFTQDRLSRVQASVRLTAAQASGVFAEACAGWLRNAAAATAPGAPSDAAIGAPSDATTGKLSTNAPAEAQNGAACEGRDGAVRFSGRLGEDPGRVEMPESETILSITLDSAPNP